MNCKRQTAPTWPEGKMRDDAPPPVPFEGHISCLSEREPPLGGKLTAAVPNQ